MLSKKIECLHIGHSHYLMLFNKGGCGIRTHARCYSPDGFQDRSLQPDLGNPPWSQTVYYFNKLFSVMSMCFKSKFELIFKFSYIKPEETFGEFGVRLTRIYPGFVKYYLLQLF